MACIAQHNFSCLISNVSLDGVGWRRFNLSQQCPGWQKKEIYTDSNLESKTVHRKQEKKAKKQTNKKQYKYVNYIKADKMIVLIFTKT